MHNKYKTNKYGLLKVYLSIIYKIYFFCKKILTFFKSFVILIIVHGINLQKQLKYMWKEVIPMF